MSSAEFGNALFAILLVVGLIGAAVLQVYLMIYRPEIYAQMKQHKHERDMQKREQRGKVLGVAGGLLNLFVRGRH